MVYVASPKTGPWHSIKKIKRIFSVIGIFSFLDVLAFHKNPEAFYSADMWFC